MSDDNIARLIYLVLLGAVLGGWFLMQNRNSLNKTLQQAAVWGLIFVGAIAVAGLWNDIRHTINPSVARFTQNGKITVPRASDGHYYLTLGINGTDVNFVVDTGATNIVLTQDDAVRAGFKLDDLVYFDRAMTANGEVRTAPIWLESVTLGPISDRDVRASVNEGEMDGSLLGMGYLQRFAHIEITGGQLILTR
ncbi:MAG: TIGR02281 family clan AA aspartic protease [Paracoccaceae bacterium]